MCIYIYNYTCVYIYICEYIYIYIHIHPEFRGSDSNGFLLLTCAIIRCMGSLLVLKLFNKNSNNDNSLVKDI